MDSEAEIGSLAERTATHDREIAHIRHNLSEVTDSLTVTAGIQREQAKVLRTLAEHTSTHKKEMATHKKEMAHIRQNLSEATDKLNAMIQIVDGFIQRPPFGGAPSA